VEIIVKKFEPHYNRAIGCKISSKREYNEKMKRRGLVSQEKGNEMAQKARERLKKPYWYEK